jgi:hypothetical protein
MNKLTFAPTMDPHSRTVSRDGIRIGAIQWHAGYPPRFLPNTATSNLVYLTLDELAEIGDVLRTEMVS